MPVRSAWLVLTAALGLSCAIAGTLFAQSSDPAAPPTDGSAAPTFPELLPGHYRETTRYLGVTGAVPPGVAAELKRSRSDPPEIQTFCRNSDAVRPGDPPWRGNLTANSECRLVSAALDGINGQGEFICRNNEATGRIAYNGEFHGDSARFTFNARLAFKNSPGRGPVTFTAEVELTRLSEQCPGEAEEAG